MRWKRINASKKNKHEQEVFDKHTVCFHYTNINLGFLDSAHNKLSREQSANIGTDA